MSRTYRRTRGKVCDWVLREWASGSGIYALFYYLNPKSKEGIKKLAIYHSDSWYKNPDHRWKAEGKNLYHQRPYRRDARRELQKFLKDEEYEVQIECKPLLGWT